MKREYTIEEFRRVVDTLMEKVPGVTIMVSRVEAA
jgi:tRNA A37 methylthiotransferase MiaB